MGEGCPAGPSPQAGTAARRNRTQAALLLLLQPGSSCQGQRGRWQGDGRPCKGQGDGRGDGRPSWDGWEGGGSQHRQQPGLSQRHQPARDSQNLAPLSASPAPRQAFSPSECHHNSGALQSGEAPVTHFPRAIVPQRLPVRSLSEAVTQPSHPALPQQSRPPGITTFLFQGTLP